MFQSLFLMAFPFMASPHATKTHRAELDQLRQRVPEQGGLEQHEAAAGRAMSRRSLLGRLLFQRSGSLPVGRPIRR